MRKKGKYSVFRIANPNIHRGWIANPAQRYKSSSTKFIAKHNKKTEAAQQKKQRQLNKKHSQLNKKSQPFQWFLKMAGFIVYSYI